jgi:hypothetical protein
MFAIIGSPLALDLPRAHGIFPRLAAPIFALDSALNRLPRNPAEIFAFHSEENTLPRNDSDNERRRTPCSSKRVRTTYDETPKLRAREFTDSPDK